MTIDLSAYLPIYLSTNYRTYLPICPSRYISMFIHGVCVWLCVTF